MLFDDLVAYLRRAMELSAFGALFRVYAVASGAVLSLSKSYGMRIGRQRHARGDLPEGWVVGRDIQITDDPVRYLGLFFGAPQRVRQIWDTRVTAKMRGRYDCWQSRARPVTRGGRNIVTRNSVLSCGWYMSEAQYFPFLEGRGGVWEGWRRDAWRFFEGGAVGGSRGASAVARGVLVQDYHEGGVRCPDVEAFVDSLLVNRVRALTYPAPHPHKPLVFYWLLRAYGHLRMGCRLLLSACDFLFLPEEMPEYWRVALRAFGARRGLAPSGSQEGFSPHVTLAEAWADPSARTVNVPEVSLPVLLMEPLLYNQCLSGWCGARAFDPDVGTIPHEAAHKQRHPEVRLYRGSAARRALARDYYDLTVAYASIGLTHFCDLLDGTGPGERLQLRRADPEWPAIVRSTYRALLQALPRPWLLLLRRVAAFKAQHTTWSWCQVVRAFPLPADSWVRGPGGWVTRLGPGGTSVGPEGWFVPTPRGKLRAVPAPALGTSLAVWLRASLQVVVWQDEVLPTCEAEAEALARRRERGDCPPPVYVYAGVVEDAGRLYGPSTLGAAGSSAP